MDTEKQLISETLKWLEKAKAISSDAKSMDVKGSDFLKNVNAYIKDTDYFLDKKDYVRAFEAVIWAWSWLEIGKDQGIVDW
ncbi:MAG: DUF357 domain-containing protein [DPANN group archaeon]|nr:DUF357 domain-containing protein [DPANN group archaeon]